MSFVPFTLSAASLSGRRRLFMILTKDQALLSAPRWRRQKVSINSSQEKVTLLILVLSETQKWERLLLGMVYSSTVAVSSIIGLVIWLRLCNLIEALVFAKMEKRARALVWPHKVSLSRTIKSVCFRTETEESCWSFWFTDLQLLSMLRLRLSTQNLLLLHL